MKHIEATQLKAVFHRLPFPRFATYHSFQSILTLLLRYTRLLTSHRSSNILQTPVLPGLCNSLLSAQTILSHLFHLVTLIQLSGLYQPHFPSSLRRTDTLHTTYTELPLAGSIPLPGGSSFQHSLLHFLDITSTSVYCLCFIRIQVLSMICILQWYT